MTERLVWLPGGSAATLHDPGGRAVRDGVLLLPPFGWEDVASYRGRRSWALKLAEQGHPCLRLDLPGTADSTGDLDRPDLLASWVDAVTESAAALRGESGCRRVAVVGLGLGGFVGALAATRGDGVDDVALWGVPSNGRALIRQLRVQAAMHEHGVAGGRDEFGLWLFGYPLPHSLLAELQSIKLADEPWTAPERRVLLLDRDGLAVDDGLVAALESSGVAVTRAPGAGYAALVGHPQSSAAPTGVQATVRAWLRSDPAPRRWRGSSAPVADHVEVGVGVYERSVRLATTGRPITGVVTVPARPATRLLILPNSGATRRTGPNRLWVQVARRVAEAGMAVIRLDLPGIGDTDGPDSWVEDSYAFYDPKHLNEMRQVLDAVEREGLPTAFVVAGLCSGAYWAFRLAQTDDRVNGLVMLNPSILVWDALSRSMVWRRDTARLVKRGSWHDLLHGQVSRQRLARFVRTMSRRAAQCRPKDHTVGSEPEWSAASVRQGFDAVLARGIPFSILFESPERPLVTQLKESGLLTELAQRPECDLRLLDGPTGVNTTFALPRLQRLVLDVFDDVAQQQVAEGAVPER